MWEVEVYYFKGGTFSERKFVKVEGDKAQAMYNATINKLTDSGIFSIVVLRDATGYLVKSARTNF